MGWPWTPLWATTSYLKLSTSTSSSASGPLWIVWDTSKTKSTGSGRHLTYTRYYNLVCVADEVQFGLATSASSNRHISCVAMSMSVWAGAGQQIHFVWANSKNKSTGSDHHLPYQRKYKSNLAWAGHQRIIGPPYHVQRFFSTFVILGKLTTFSD